MPHTIASSQFSTTSTATSSSTGSSSTLPSSLPPCIYPSTKPYSGFTTLMHRFSRYERSREGLYAELGNSPPHHHPPAGSGGTTEVRTSGARVGGMVGAGAAKTDGMLDMLEKSSHSVEMEDQRVSLTPKQEIKLELARMKAAVEKLTRDRTSGSQFQSSPFSAPRSETPDTNVTPPPQVPIKPILPTALPQTQQRNTKAISDPAISGRRTPRGSGNWDGVEGGKEETEDGRDVIATMVDIAPGAAGGPQSDTSQQQPNKNINISAPRPSTSSSATTNTTGTAGTISTITQAMASSSSSSITQVQAHPPSLQSITPSNLPIHPSTSSLSASTSSSSPAIQPAHKPITATIRSKPSSSKQSLKSKFNANFSANQNSNSQPQQSSNSSKSAPSSPGRSSTVSSDKENDGGEFGKKLANNGGYKALKSKASAALLQFVRDRKKGGGAALE